MQEPGPLGVQALLTIRLRVWGYRFLAAYRDAKEALALVSSSKQQVALAALRLW